MLSRPPRAAETTKRAPAGRRKERRR